VRAPVDCVPESALPPLQPPLAVHDVALLDAQLKVDEEPLVRVLGLALKLTVGVGPALTVTVADWAAVPPAPVQLRVKTDVLVSAPVDCVPFTVLLPLQAPEATQDVASVELQLRVAALPLVTALGPTLRFTTGAAALTVTVTDWDALPPAPEQVRV
jgi:hypothetical protein